MSAFELLQEGWEQARGHGDLLTATIAAVATAEYKAQIGDIDGAIAMSRTILGHLFDSGEMLFRGPATTVLVEALLRRGAETDLQEARAAIDHLAAVPTEPGFVLFEVPLGRLRALLARADGDEDCLPWFRRPLSRDGDIAWLRGTYRDGRGVDMTDLESVSTEPPRARHMRAFAKTRNSTTKCCGVRSRVVPST